MRGVRLADGSEVVYYYAWEGGPRLRLHPEDADRLGIEDGARVRIGNARGALTLSAMRFDGLLPGVLIARERPWSEQDRKVIGDELKAVVDTLVPTTATCVTGVARWDVLNIRAWPSASSRQCPGG